MFDDEVVNGFDYWLGCIFLFYYGYWTFMNYSSLSFILLTSSFWNYYLKPSSYYYCLYYYSISYFFLFSSSILFYLTIASYFGTKWCFL